MAHMRPGRSAGLALGLLLSACAAAAAPPDAASLPPDSFGLGAKADIAVVNVAQYDWADTGRTYGRPAEGARAVAAIDYLAGQLATSPLWQGIPEATRQGMLQARSEVRQAVGIAPNAPSQAVVDGLARAFAALGEGDAAAARAALNAPVFTLGPAATLQRLGNLPYVRAADIASTQVQQAAAGFGGG